MLREIEHKYQSLINREELALLINEEVLPIFHRDFKSFEWKNGWMYCEKFENRKIVSVCRNGGAMSSILKIEESFQDIKYNWYIYIYSPVSMKHVEDRGCGEVQKELISIILKEFQFGHVTVYNRPDVKTMYITPTHSYDIPYNVDNPNDLIKHYKIGSLRYLSFSTLIRIIEDFLLIPLYLDEETCPT